jgi:hypothetical protein
MEEMAIAEMIICFMTVVVHACFYFRSIVVARLVLEYVLSVDLNLAGQK